MSKFKVGDKVRINVPGEFHHEFEGVIERAYGATPTDMGYDWSVKVQTGEILGYNENELLPFEDKPVDYTEAVEKIRTLYIHAQGDPGSEWDGGAYASGYESGLASALEYLDEAEGK